jgi:uncharacterized protein DUF4062
MIKVFLSSTSRDLDPYRQRATKAINGMDGYHCVAMENFGARDSSADDPDQFQDQKNFRASIGADRIWGDFAPANPPL